LQQLLLLLPLLPLLPLLLLLLRAAPTPCDTTQRTCSRAVAGVTECRIILASGLTVSASHSSSATSSAVTAVWCACEASRTSMHGRVG
jgi:hypothetical protein